MSEQVRVGIVGTSWWSDLMFLPNLQSHLQAKMVAICGRNAERATEMAKKYAIPQVFTDYRAMLEQGNLDALIVATPDDLHYPITMAALDVGLHVLCEKPMALDATQARAMYEKAESMRVKHMVLFTWRLLPHAQHVRQLIVDGYIGRCYHIDIRFFGGNGRESKYLWRFDHRRANGVLGDAGSHMADLARHYVGEITQVSAHLGSYVARPGEDGSPSDSANDAALLAVEFANGAQGSIHLSAVTHLADRNLEQQIILAGEKGTLEVSLILGGPNIGATIQGVRQGQGHFEPLPVPAELWSGIDPTLPFLGQLAAQFMQHSVGPRHFIDSILADQPASPNFYDGLKAQAVIDAALASHQQRCWVPVSTLS